MPSQHLQRASQSSAAWVLGTVLALALALLLPSAGVAQRRRTPPPPPPIAMDAAVVSWSLFVSAYGDASAQRTAITSTEAGPIAVPLEGWNCTYGSANRARLNTTTWSEVRTIECTHGDSVVSTSGFCQVIGASWGARAGVLAIGQVTAPSRLNITLDCEVR
jgi:hypothetical protein